MKQVMYAVLIIVMAFSLIAPVAMAEDSATVVLSDINKHWAKEQIEAAVEKGYVNGFPDGTFRPDDPVTVAQFLTMMFLSFTEVDDNGKRDWSAALVEQMPEWPRSWFTDYAFEFGQGSPWYINHVNNAKYFGAINEWEYEDRYDEPLTRERVAKIVNVMAGWFDGPVHEEYAKLAMTEMKDYTTFSTDGLALNVAESLIRGILSGYPDGKFQPKRFITRAEAISVIERISHKELRKPITVDLSEVPYSMVWAGSGYPQQVHVFANWEMKKVYDQLRSDLQYATGTMEQNGAGIYYFKDVTTMEEGIEYRHHPEQWYQAKVYIDMLVDLSSNVYGIQIAGMEDRFERRSDTLLRFLNSIFKEKGSEVHQLVTDSMTKHRTKSLAKVDIIIENRQVLIYSNPGDMDIMSVAISGYADK